MFLDLLSFSDSIHLRHLYVSENDSVAYVTAGLCHVSKIHIHSDEAIRRLVALASELVLDYRC